jgi:hypothetical protein
MGLLSLSGCQTDVRVAGWQGCREAGFVSCNFAALPLCNFSSLSAPAGMLLDAKNVTYVLAFG